MARVFEARFRYRASAYLPEDQPDRPRTSGVRTDREKLTRKGPNGARASAAARDPRHEKDNKPPATPRAVTTTAAATQPSPRVSRPARTGEPTYRTTRSRDRSGSRSGSRERKPPSEREAQTTKGQPWRDTPSCATPPRPARRSASEIGGGLVDRVALRSAIAIRPSSGLHGAKKKT